MKKIFFFFLVLLTGYGCGKRSPKSVAESKVVEADSSTLETPVVLSFGELHNLNLKPNDAQQDSISFEIFNSFHDLENRFYVSYEDKAMESNLVINRVIGIFCSHGQGASKIEVEKVELGADDINVFVNVTYENSPSLPNTLFKVYAIERRDGYKSLQFFVNNKMKKSISLLPPSI